MDTGTDNIEPTKKTVDKVLKHLEKNSIASEELDLKIIDEVTTVLATQDNIQPKDVDLLFFERGIVDIRKRNAYLSAAFVVGAVLDVPNLDNFYAFVPKDMLVYSIKCDIKAALTRDPSHSIHGQKVSRMINLKRYCQEFDVVSNSDFDRMINDAKIELGLIKVPVRKKKIKEKKVKHVLKSSVEQLVEPQIEGVESKVQETMSTYMYLSPPKKFVPPKLGNKRWQRPKAVYDEFELAIKVKHFINSEKPGKEIVEYLSAAMTSPYEKAEEFMKKIVYDSIKTAIWCDKFGTRNMINYLSNDAQLEIATEYIEKNSISEKLGVRRVKATKERLLRHLSLDESKIDSIIDKKLENYVTKSEEAQEVIPVPQKAVEPKKEIDEYKKINYTKPIFITPHVKLRAFERIGFGANQDRFLQEMFCDGKTIDVLYDPNPHRVFNFSGEWFEMPYIETKEEYILITVFPRKNY